jgi:hypothetical protein
MSTSKVKRQSVLVELHEVLMANPNRYMSTLELQEHGIMSPASGIARLKDQGAIIETIYQSSVDRFARTRKRVAFYKIIGGVAPWLY